jgi:hypothetical protein
MFRLLSQFLVKQWAKILQKFSEKW